MTVNIQFFTIKKFASPERRVGETLHIANEMPSLRFKPLRGRYEILGNDLAQKLTFLHLNIC